MFLFSCSSMKSSIVPSRRAASTKSRLDRIRSVILSGPIQILSTPQGERIRECCHVFLHFVFTENRALIAHHFKVQSFESLIGRMIYFPQSFAFLIGWLCISYEFFAGFFHMLISVCRKSTKLCGLHWCLDYSQGRKHRILIIT